MFIVKMTIITTILSIVSSERPRHLIRKLYVRVSVVSGMADRVSQRPGVPVHVVDGVGGRRGQGRGHGVRQRMSGQVRVII